MSQIHKQYSFQVSRQKVSKGFGIIYDTIDDALQHEPKHRLVKNGMKANVEKPIYESKNIAKRSQY